VYSPFYNLSSALSSLCLRVIDPELPRASAITVGQRSDSHLLPLRLSRVRFSDSG
jgi:hypothetical protein